MQNISYLIKPTKIKTKGVLKYCPPKFIQTPSSVDYVDGFGKPLASAILYQEKDKLVILDLFSNVKNKGYGTKVLNKIKELYANADIELSACWERLISPKPPHKFYIKNGFVPEDKNILNKLKAWINNGAKSSEFPQECDNCVMSFKKQV